MKKIVTIIITVFLIISAVGLISITPGKSTQQLWKSSQVFSDLIISTNDDFSLIELSESTSQLMIPGKPILPIYTKVIPLPMGSLIKNVDVTFKNKAEQLIHNHIKPAPKYYPENSVYIDSFEVNKDEVIYAQHTLYPADTFQYSLSTGLNGNTQVMFVTIHCYPVRYLPSQQRLVSYKEITIQIEYEHQSTSLFDEDIYDLVVITPNIFTESLQPLVDHKNNYQVRTILKTLEDIYIEYEGRDQQEQIKYFIKDAKESWGIDYVLLIGGMIGQNFEWYFPVRYTNNYAGVPFESGFISDLYYADLYKTIDGEIVFEDWDSNGNGILAEFESVYNQTSEIYDIISKDILDCRPDVHLGRLPCRSIKEVDIVVDKIINYESTLADASWFDRLLLVAGDTYPLPESDEPDAYEAEIDTDLTASYMQAFEPIRLWTSTKTLTGQKDVVDEMNKGAGFIHMAGHANPSLLVTNTPRGEEGKVTILNMYNIPFINAYFSLVYQGGGIIGAIQKLLEPVNPRIYNNEKQPVIVIGGCHNSQFNVTLKNIQKYGFFYAYGYGIHPPKCFSWYLTSLENGGAIATMGNTGLGMGYPGYNYTAGLDGWLFPRFFYHYGVNNNQILGSCFSHAITDYVNEFDINEIVHSHAEDGPGAIRQMVEQWELFGDPSLQIGGYP